MARSHQQEIEIEVEETYNESLLSVENNSCAPPRKVIEVKDNRVKTKTAMDTGATRHARVKLDRTIATKKFVAAIGERMKNFSEKTIPFKSVERVLRCKNFMSANVVKPLISMRCCASWQCRGAGWEESAHSKQSRRHSHQAGREQMGVHHGHGCVSR